MDKHILFIDKQLLQTVSNHPVHILNKDGTLSPSSFIPFCYFGEKFIGEKYFDYKIPVCNIFTPKNFIDQLCFETDLQDLKDSNSQKIGKQFSMGLTLILDYNVEKQSYKIIQKNDSLPMKYLYNNVDDDVSIYFDTISKQFL